MRVKVERIAAPGATLFLVRVGEGAPLLVLGSGPGEPHDLLRPHLDALASAREVVYSDPRGCGRSPLDEGSEPADVATLVDDVERVRAHLGAARVDLLGFSWGALVALRYAEAHPERVGAMILVSPPPPRGQGEVGPRPEPAARDPSGLRARFDRRIAPALFDPASVARLTAVEVDEVAAWAASNSLGRYDLTETLRARRGAATLVVHGEDDPVYPGAAEEVAEAAGARRVSVARCGHAPFFEAPEVFLAAAEGFLRAQG
ncbi:MAG: alpha/beta hydrolase [Polyangiales bacterium]